jgi:hypothetical protein
MKHLDEGQLRAFLDQQLESEREMIETHLADCPECHTRMEEMSLRSSQIAKSFGALSASTLTSSPQTALARFRNRYEQKEIPLMEKLFSRHYRPAWALVGLIALFAVSMTFPPVRAAAENLLSQFRVGKISVVSIDEGRLKSFGYGTDLGKQLTQLLSDSITTTQKADKPKSVANAAQASQAAGFTVRLPASRSDTPQLVVQNGGALQLTLNRARIQTLINEAGASNLVLPASVDGAVIKVKVPTGVSAGYGQCPKLTEVEETSKSSTERTMANCIILAEIPSPIVDAPADLDIAQFAELGLQFTGMTKDQAHAYAQTVDWTSTLVVPIPRNAAQYKKVSVDGVEGYLIQRSMDQMPQYAIIWVKQGIIYALSGLGDSAAPLKMANSLK